MIFIASIVGLLAVAAAKDYDFIVVGAGSAGSIVAGQLARTGSEVLLIEAGGDNTEPAIGNLQRWFDVAFDTSTYGFLQWGYSSTEQPLGGAGALAESKVISLLRGRTLGGSHSINAAAYVQGDTSDFDSIAEMLGDNDWLWRKTNKFRNKIERHVAVTKLGVEQPGAPDYIATAEQVLGFPFNPNPNSGDQYGIGPASYTAAASNEGGVRSTSYDAFAHPMTTKPRNGKRGQVTIVTFHQVERLHFDPNDPSRVVGVSCFNLRAEIFTNFFATKEVIISGGTYNSPQILMNSGIGPREHLEEMGINVTTDLKGVGENLRDHYGILTFWNVANLTVDNPFFVQSPILNMFGPEQDGPPSYQFQLSGFYGTVVPLRQKSVGTVRLSSSDPKAPVIINPNALSTEDDFQGLVDGLKNYLLPFYKELVNKGLLSPLTINPDATEQEIREFVVANVDTYHHPVGTCKIGPDDDSFAVVNNEFLVRGTSNLRVIDASIFPEVPSGNPNAATMTIALLGVKKIMKAHAMSDQGEGN